MEAELLKNKLNFELVHRHKLRLKYTQNHKYPNSRKDLSPWDRNMWDTQISRPRNPFQNRT